MGNAGYLIDPSDVTKFDRTDAELELWWLFGTVVAGKTATTQARLLNELLLAMGQHVAWAHFKKTTCDLSPFEIVRGALDCPKWRSSERENVLQGFMRMVHLGQYNRLTKCWEQSLALDLRNDPVEALEAVHGIGPKTARMFLMHSRPEQRFAALDTHLLKHLKARGYDVPSATPSAGKRYVELEKAFLSLADAAGMTPADYDLQVWKQYAQK